MLTKKKKKAIVISVSLRFFFLLQKNIVIIYINNIYLQYSYLFLFIVSYYLYYNYIHKIVIYFLRPSDTEGQREASEKDSRPRRARRTLPSFRGRTRDSHRLSTR